MSIKVLSYSLSAATALLILGSCSTGYTISIHNPSPHDRSDCVAEIDADDIPAAMAKGFVVLDSSGQSVPHQLTYDNKLLVATDIKAGQTIHYKLKAATPHDCDTICMGQVRHDFQDDFTWENDRGGYRLYGPSYRNGGGNVSGYDIWTKSVTYPVLAQRYNDHCRHGISYHKDQGNGMDAYTVGRTLGAGMNALICNGDIAYPCAYEKCEILDNGPLRTTARITCYPESIGPDSVIEQRIITLDKGSWLNKTQICYQCLSSTYELLTGIVIHKQNTRGYVIDGKGRYLAYADLTDNPDNGNGVIYIGIVNAQPPVHSGVIPLDTPQGDAVGQLVNHHEYLPQSTFTYYWGAGWSKGGIRGMQHWETYLAEFYDNLIQPLKTEIK